jgi:chromosome segregation ATPase
MGSDNQETLRQQDDATNRILEAIADLRVEMNERFGKTEARLTNIESELKELKDLQLSFDARLDRYEAMLLNMRADVKVLRAEVEAWAREVLELQGKVG